MKKFTIIYNNCWQSGSHRHTLTKMQRVLAPDTQAITHSQFAESAQFIFEGWPLMVGETVENEFNLPIIQLNHAPLEPKSP